jgi:hypothetical protein
METNVEFDSDLFRPFLHEDAQMNPCVYGAELAFWLSQQLAQRGVMTSYPLGEDWGWFIEYITGDGNEYWLCCQNREDAPDKWWCRLQPLGRGIFGRNKAPVEGARVLMDALRDVLAAEPEIKNVRWGLQEG